MPGGLQLIRRATMPSTYLHISYMTMCHISSEGAHPAMGEWISNQHNQRNPKRCEHVLVTYAWRPEKRPGCPLCTNTEIPSPSPHTKSLPPPNAAHQIPGIAQSQGLNPRGLLLIASYCMNTCNSSLIWYLQARGVFKTCGLPTENPWVQPPQPIKSSTSFEPALLDKPQVIHSTQSRYNKHGQ